MNANLLRPFSADEVCLALKQMNPTKAPRPNGMSPLFFQKYWYVVGKVVTNVVLKVINSGQFPNDINHTFITLILKKKQPECVADYMPISLCNVVYELVFKVLSNRLKCHLPTVISPS